MAVSLQSRPLEEHRLPVERSCPSQQQCSVRALEGQRAHRDRAERSISAGARAVHVRRERVYWDEQPHVIESDPNDDWNWEVELARDPDWREQLIAEVDDVPVGFIQIIDPTREDSRFRFVENRSFGDDDCAVYRLERGDWQA